VYRVPAKNTRLNIEKILGRKESELKFLSDNWDKNLICKKDKNERLKKVYRRCIRALRYNGYQKRYNKEVKEYFRLYWKNPGDFIRGIVYLIKS
ncbi:hypothetical protein ACFLSQ_11705, partial [Bacteroidota bacterium]